LQQLLELKLRNQSTEIGQHCFSDQFILKNQPFLARRSQP
jgi:hypothetical protein